MADTDMILLLLLLHGLKFMQHRRRRQQLQTQREIPTTRGYCGHAVHFHLNRSVFHGSYKADSLIILPALLGTFLLLSIPRMHRFWENVFLSASQPFFIDALQPLTSHCAGTSGICIQ